MSTACADVTTAGELERIRARARPPGHGRRGADAAADPGTGDSERSSTSTGPGGTTIDGRDDDGPIGVQDRIDVHREATGPAMMRSSTR
jgi:hypothetical protein